MFKGKISIKTHQLLSFSSMFVEFSPGENIFWPGCAILSMGEEIVMKTYELLKIKLPDLKLSTMCCGKPSLHIDEGRPYEKIKQFLKETFEKNGVKKIYTLCPNCQHTLFDNSNCEIISAWTVLDEDIPIDKYNIYKGRELSLHDPCPTRSHLDNTVATRSILNKLGIDILEFPNNRDKTICCGKRDMIMTLDPQRGQKLFEIRAKQAPSKEIVTYCASCVNTFRENSFEAYHILELLWETKTNGSWKNRYNSVRKIKR